MCAVGPLKKFCDLPFPLEMSVAFQYVLKESLTKILASGSALGAYNIMLLLLCFFDFPFRSSTHLIFTPGPGLSTFEKVNWGDTCKGRNAIYSYSYIYILLHIRVAITYLLSWNIDCGPGLPIRWSRFTRKQNIFGLLSRISMWRRQSKWEEKHDREVFCNSTMEQKRRIYRKH